MLPYDLVNGHIIVVDGAERLLLDNGSCSGVSARAADSAGRPVRR